MSGSNFVGDLSTNLSAYGPAHIPATDLDVYENVSLPLGRPTVPASGDLPDVLLATFRSAPFIGASASATATPVQKVYEPALLWLVLLFVAAGVMSLTGLIGIICGFKAHAPNRFDMVMGQTYDNPYFDCPPRGSVLDVEDRAKSASCKSLFRQC
ncbi:hypothetical protein F4779DRAFT_2072 [Xylariaceae sp. FL0662B]|nr:hypothetical protein F4779DRAFT_2072 [Xylariaceae sp. FL0662B]